MSEQNTTRFAEDRMSTAFKRRGLIVGAAALAAGVLAKNAPQPVEAAGTILTTGNVVVSSPVTEGATGVTNASTTQLFPALFIVANTSSFQVMSPNNSRIGLLAGSAGADTLSGQTNIGVYGSSDQIGVEGVGSTAGIVGISNALGFSGVVGLADNYVPPAPVYGGTVGASDQSALPGIHGYHGANGAGVLGQSDASGGTGVRGLSATGYPVIGSVTGTGSGSNGNAGVLGLGTKGPGVQGQSATGHGLIGYTSATDGHAGLVGYAQVAGGVGLEGIAAGYGTPSVGKAAIFYGDVQIHGTVSAPVNNAVVKHAGDNTYRMLYSMESPESWFEDFGEGTLAGDKADIKLDPDFAALVDTGTLHVFLTAHAAQHLHVPARTASGFSVAATAIGGAEAGGPKRAEGSGSFSYRVVAKRKDNVGERLAKVAAPTAPKVPTAFTNPESLSAATGKPMNAQKFEPIKKP